MNNKSLPVRQFNYGEPHMQLFMNVDRTNQTSNAALRLISRCSWLIAILMFASFASIQAQQITGSIVGTVKDQTGAVVSYGHREGNQRGYRIHPVGADKRLWGVPHRLPSRGQVHRRGGGARL